MTKKAITFFSVLILLTLSVLGGVLFTIHAYANATTTDCADCKIIGDLDENGKTDIDDALYILYHYFFPARFPLPKCTAHKQTTAPNPPETIIESTLTKEQYGFFSYWLYTPKNATENMPMIVYLHGGSGKGDALELIMEADGFPKYLKDGQLGEIPAYVIIPQLPSSEKGWPSVKNQLISLINYTASTFSIDPRRVSLTGHSMGGTGAWGIALASPETFCAVAPLSGSVKLTEENKATLATLPIWAIVGDADTIVSPDSSIEFIRSIEDINPNAKITILEGYDHFTVPTFYKDNTIEIIDFLLQQ